MTEGSHKREAASPWIQRWSHLITPRATILDVACGYGRHMRWFADQGHTVVGVDRSSDAIDTLSDLVALGRAQVVQADIENGPWPLMNGPQPRQFDAVVVTHYLWRPLLTTIVESLAPSGVLLYETFASGNETVGKPSRSDFLLNPCELLQVCANLRIVAYENGYCEHPPSFIQRIVAVKFPLGTPADNATTPPRFRL